MKTQYKPIKNRTLVSCLNASLICYSLLSTTAMAIQEQSLSQQQESTNYQTQLLADYQSSNYSKLSSYQLEKIISQPRLAQILAPIALYPETLLSHILIASTYPIDIIQAHRWQQSHRYLSKKQLVEKAENKPWDPSVITLLAFPNVLARLSTDLKWTEELGDAFLQNEQRVLNSIQDLRHQADNAQSFNELENMSVKYVDRQIIIEPRHRELIYVPYYDPRIIYGSWRWHKHPPIFWQRSTRYFNSGPEVGININLGHNHLSHRRFHWDTGIQINFNYFFSAFHWRKQHVVVIPHHNSHYYRPKHRVVTSHGAQRWYKKSHHNNGGYTSRNHTKQYQRTPLQLKNRIEKDRHIPRSHSTKNRLSSRSRVINGDNRRSKSATTQVHRQNKPHKRVKVHPSQQQRTKVSRIKAGKSHHNQQHDGRQKVR